MCHKLQTLAGIWYYGYQGACTSGPTVSYSSNYANTTNDYKENYGAHRDPPEKDVPYCTIRSFPSSINHTIEWAREKFQEIFVTQPQELMKFIDDKTQFLNVSCFLNYLPNFRG